MQVSLPLALHLRSPVKSNILTKERWKPGEKFREGLSLNDFFFIENASDRAGSTLLFAEILGAIFNHPDWSQLYAFFSKRYSEEDGTLDSEDRTLNPPKTHSAFKKPVVTAIRTDPTSVGLPQDLTSLLGKAGRTSRSGIMGADPQPYAIGPAIGIACGAGAYMDLTYAGQPPGQYSECTYIGDQLHGYKESKYQIIAEPIYTTKQGGRRRYWAEWARLWAVIAEWVWEYDSEALLLGHLNGHFYNYRLSPEEERSFDPFGKIPRKYLGTDAISATDAIRDVFTQLARQPQRFQGIEWDFLDMGVLEEVQGAFNVRFGLKSPDPEVNRRDLLRLVSGQGSLHYGGDSQAYDEVSPMALKRCPGDFWGNSWETWLLSIEGGDVVVLETIFQALWAILLLAQIPVHIKILGPGEKFPKYRDPETVYL